MGAQASTESETEVPSSSFFNSPSSYMQEGSSSWMAGGGARVVSSRMRWGGSAELKKPAASESDEEPYEGKMESVDDTLDFQRDEVQMDLDQLHQQHLPVDADRRHAQLKQQADGGLQEQSETFPIATETVLLAESGAHIFGKSVLPEHEKPWSRFATQSSEVPSNPPDASEEPPLAAATIVAASCSCSSTSSSSSHLSSTEPPASAQAASEPATSAPTSFSDCHTVEPAAPLSISTSTTPTVTPLITPAYAAASPPTKLSPLVVGAGGGLATSVPILTPPPVSSTSLSWKLQELQDMKATGPAPNTQSRLQASASEAGRAGAQAGASLATSAGEQTTQKTPVSLASQGGAEVQSPAPIKSVPCTTNSVSPIHAAAGPEERWSRPVPGPTTPTNPNPIPTLGILGKSGSVGSPSHAPEKRSSPTGQIVGQAVDGGAAQSANRSPSGSQHSSQSAKCETAGQEGRALAVELPDRTNRQAGCWVPKWMPQAEMEAEPELLPPNEEQPMLEDTSRMVESSNDLVLYEVAEQARMERSEASLAQEKTRLRLHAQMHRCRARTGSDHALQGSDAQLLLRRQQSQLLEERRRLEEERRNLADARKRQAEAEAKLEAERELLRKEWELLAEAKAKLAQDHSVDVESQETCL